MQFRARMFAIFFILSLLWIGYGIVVTGSAYSSVTKNAIDRNSTLSEKDQITLTQAGAAMGSGLVITTFLCTGIPAALFFGLLSWRNNVGIVNKQRHEESIAKKDEEIEALKRAVGK